MTAHVEVLSVNSAKSAQIQPKPIRKFRRFRREEGGSILILSLFLFVMMLMVAGMAVDLMRSETQRARLQSTLDRAVLAGASLDQSLDSEAVVRDYFEKAGLTEYLTSVVVVEDSNSKTVTATAETLINTYFMNMVGIETLQSPAMGQAEESLSDIEISLVLDISGSMGWWSNSGQASKISLMRAAAKDFVFRMQCNPDDPSGATPCTVEANSVSISLIPYAEQVMVGENLIQKFNVGMEHSYSSCADFDQADFSSYEISLSSPLKRAATIDAQTGSNNVTARNNKRTCRTGSYREIVPLSNSYSALRSRIGQLSANGYTSIDVGMKWGTALLSPTFRPAVVSMTSGGLPAIAPEFADRPFDFDERNMQKVIVLMTDGENTRQYVIKDAYRSGESPIFRNSADDRLSAYNSATNKYYYPHNNTWNDTAYGDGSTSVKTCSSSGWPSYYYTCTWNSVPHPGTANRMNYEDFWQDYNVKYFKNKFSFISNNPTRVYNYAAKNVRLNAICAIAKAQDIEVFTIGFETSSASNAIMQNCATNDAHHFDVDGDQLDDAFTSIAREIHKLRLTL
ncbi:MAG: Tad domain-containing protein [Paracoccaceae bacterium]